MELHKTNSYVQMGDYTIVKEKNRKTRLWIVVKLK